MIKPEEFGDGGRGTSGFSLKIILRCGVIAGFNYAVGLSFTIVNMILIIGKERVHK
jgi:hypothetical protein